jgi:prolyl-tRNA synthetase
MRTRPFLRTAEFLWQEGHTAHASRDEAYDEAKVIHEVYARFAEDYMSMPVIKGAKSENERFAGADDTFTIEALMQDGKALQAGTSHFLGQNFAKAFEVKYLTDQNKEEYVWASSWGVSTRLIGGLIMTHSDDDGLILPPRLAPIQVVIVPIPKPEAQIMIVADKIADELKAKSISVKIDNDEKNRPGFKFAEYEMKGVPIRIGIGLRDLEQGVIEIARRDTKVKQLVAVDQAAKVVADLLEEIQLNLFERAKAFRADLTSKADTMDELAEILDTKGGFVLAHWDGTTDTEQKIKDLTKATIRCIPDDAILEDGKCILTGKPSKQRVIFARAY